MEISKKKEAEVYKYEIPKAWIQFRGLPKELRDFSIISAIGSIFGVTCEVDMKFTKIFGRSRMKVALYNSDLIPEYVDVVIGDFIYELQFRVEKEGDESPPPLIDMDTQQDEEPNEDKGKEGNNKEGQVNNEGENTNLDLKKTDIGNNSGNAVDPTDALGNLASVEFTQNTCAAATGRPTVVLQPTGHGENTKAWVTTTFYRDTSVLHVRLAVACRKRS